MKYNILYGDRSDRLLANDIAQRFVGNNNLGAKNSFAAKTLYDEEAYYYEGIDNLADPSKEVYELDQIYKIFNDTYLPLFGTVDKNIIALQPKKQYLSYYGGNNGGFSGLDFVINAYINMKNSYIQGVSEGGGLSGGSALSEMELVKAREDGQKALQENFENIINQFINFAKIDHQNRKKIITPQNFINYFTNFLLSNSKNFFATYSSFLLTDKIDINFNGLCLDIANVSYEFDSDKVRNVIMDPNFTYYLNTAKSFGFLVCKEYPSKLIANINSSKMKASICACDREHLNGINSSLASSEDIVNYYYEPAYLYDIEYLRTLFVIAYSSFLDNFAVERINNFYDGHMHSKRVTRFSDQSDLVYTSLTDSFLISLYIRLKNSEIRIKYDNSSLERFDRTSKIIYDTYGINDSLKYINEKLRLALEPFMPDKKNFVNTENFSLDEALGLIRLSRYGY
jgi:hypothetical protein